jgi:hypothetical protein
MAKRLNRDVLEFDQVKLNAAVVSGEELSDMSSEDLNDFLM